MNRRWDGASLRLVGPGVLGCEDFGGEGGPDLAVEWNVSIDSGRKIDKGRGGLGQRSEQGS